jgi:hypothetical protein
MNEGKFLGEKGRFLTAESVADLRHKLPGPWMDFPK